MRKILKFFKPYVPAIILILVLLFSQAMCELALPGFMSDIINKGIIGGHMGYIYQRGGLMLLVSALSIGCSIMVNMFSAKTASRASRDCRSSLFKKITSFSKHEFDHFQSSSLITRTTNDIQTIQQSSIMILKMAFYAPILGLGALIRALKTSPPLTWTIGLSLICILFVMIVMFFAVMPKFKVMQKKLDRLNQIVGERLSGLLVVRAFTTEKLEEDRFDVANKELRSIGIFTNRAMSIMFPVLTLIMNMSGILIIWVGKDLITANAIEVGHMLAFLQYSMQILFSFLVITMIFIMFPRAMVSAERISEVLEQKPSIKDPLDEKKKHIPLKEENSLNGVVKFNNVTFSYGNAKENTLENISFTANPGEITAFIGSTGSGKSTIVNLIPRFFDTTEGEVTIDGVNVKDMDQKELREHIGLVPQQGLLFKGTIKSNLQFGKENATQEEMEKALLVSQALDFVKSMPKGLDTEVSQGGTSVSGGQKQRLSIARALIKKPDIYIFDDSFSALDFETDKKLRKALKEEVGQKTFIIVAQRINTIMDADKIILLDEGKIQAIGTHQELLKNNKIYREIALSQLSEKDLKKGGVTNENEIY